MSEATALSRIYRDTPGGTGKAFKGAAAELLACAYLMRQGFYVYRCESPNAPFDLVAYRDGVSQRVEVKSINHSHTRRSLSPNYAPSLSWPTNDEWDLLIVVDHDEQRCLEVRTHDRRVGTDEVRAVYGFGPAPVRATRGSRPL